MFVLIVGSGRTGAAIAKRMLKEGYEVSVLDESPESHALLDHGLDQSWEDSGGGFTVGTALEVDALLEAGIERADVVVCSTDGDNTNIVVAQIAKKRFQIPKVVVRVHDPYRAEWYRQQGLQTVSPTQVAIEMLTDAVLDGGGSGAGDVIKESR
ncbi:MAG: NAD-binding protein [Phycisphaeraceae bacterium]